MSRLRVFTLASCAAVTLGIACLLLGGGWLYTFILTEYRAHLRLPGIAAGFAATTAGILLVVVPWLLRTRDR